MVPATKFTSLAAVEVWDAHYRWRETGKLRDVTIDATWWRVAEAVAAVEGIQAPLWAHRFVDAFSRWRLLPDERLLQFAGTHLPYPDLDAPAAVVNVAAFVSAARTSNARFDAERFSETASLAVRLLDDAVLSGPSGHPRTPLHVGIIGLADAFQLLRLPFGSVRAMNLARTVATALAEGCLRGSLDLAAERGPLDEPSERRALEDRWKVRGMPDWLVKEAEQRGLRHFRMTAIEPHPALAHLANELADGLEPLPAQAKAGKDEDGTCIRAAQMQLVEAMQPWIDAPIEYPLARPETCFAASAGDRLQTACSGAKASGALP